MYYFIGYTFICIHYCKGLRMPNAHEWPSLRDLTLQGDFDNTQLSREAFFKGFLTCPCQNFIIMHSIDFLQTTSPSQCPAPISFHSPKCIQVVIKFFLPCSRVLFIGEIQRDYEMVMSLDGFQSVSIAFWKTTNPLLLFGVFLLLSSCEDRPDTQRNMWSMVKWWR